jgi:hypothetical protein
VSTLARIRLRVINPEGDQCPISATVLDGNQLQAAGTAATVRADDGGQAQVTTGPAVEAGSELDGYYVYDAGSRTR